MTTSVSAQPLRICIVFDDDASARSAQMLIKHVASDYERDTQLFCFAELDPPAPGIAAARSACDTDILVLAIRDDRMLPGHMESWLGLCLGLRDKDKDGALVLLVVKGAEAADPNSSLPEYLKTVAAVGGMSFFQGRQTVFLPFDFVDSVDEPSPLGGSYEWIPKPHRCS